MTREEAIRRIKAWNLDSDDREVLAVIIPELRESEDERIRKEMVKHFEDALESRQGISTSEQVKSWVAWLEKQKEQKEWSEKDENALKYLHELISFGFTKKFFDAQTAADMREWLNTRLKSLRPSWKPTEEQIYSLGTVVKGYNECAVGSVGYHLKELYEQLKSL